MENFNYFNPTRILFGKGEITNIGIEIKKSGIKKVLLLAGGGSIKSNGVYNQAIESLTKYGIDWVEFWGVRPNPILTHALEAVRIARETAVDAILAIGGGSVIDEAKSIAAGYYLDNLWDSFEGTAKIHKALPIFTILTLSGTCSEMDAYAVLTNESEQKKWNIGSELLFPKVSVIDPSVQMSLPWHQTVNGAIDAMSHTLEFYVMGQNEEISLSICESILNTLSKSLDLLMAEPNNYASRAWIAWSAVLALNGIAGASLRGGDWAVHRIEHGISAIFPDVAHGAGLAVVFPAFIRFISNENQGLFKRWAANVWGQDLVEDAIDAMRSKFSSWGAPISLRDLNISSDYIPAIAENACLRGRIGQLKSLGVKEVIEILKIAY